MSSHGAGANVFFFTCEDETISSVAIWTRRLNINWRGRRKVV